MANKLRIYIVIGTFYPIFGGSETQALLQARSMRERGYETTIITFRHQRAWLPREMMEGVPVIRVAGTILGGRERLPGLLRKPLYLMGQVYLGWMLWRHRHNYDILHVYKLHLPVLPTAFVCRLANKAMLITVCSTNSDKGTGFYQSSHNGSSPVPKFLAVISQPGQSIGGGDLEGLGKPLVSLIRSLLQNISAPVIVLSSRMKVYIAAYNFRPSDIQLIPNGVDITRFYPASLNTPINKQEQTVICVSRLDYEKGIDVLLLSWHFIQQQLAQPMQARLIIVGNGSLQTQLEDMAKELGIADSVEFTGFQHDIPAQLRRATIAVLPSRREGMPNAVLEAMACGLPCVATRLSGSEDIIQHGVNGLLVEPEDYQGLATALLTLLHDRELVQQYGQAARATIEQHYSLENIMNRYVELYDRLVDNRVHIYT